MSRSFIYNFKSEKIIIKFGKENIYINVTSPFLGQVNWILNDCEKAADRILSLPPDLLDVVAETMAHTFLQILSMFKGTVYYPPNFLALSEILAKGFAVLKKLLSEDETEQHSKAQA
jgi:hypothetical protein